MNFAPTPELVAASVAAFPFHLNAGLRAYEGTRVVGEAELRERAAWRGAAWRGGLRRTGEATWRIEAALESGAAEAVAAGLSVEFPLWHPGVFVLLPGAVYGGNRQPSRAAQYSPRLTLDEVQRGRPKVIADLPRLEVDGGPGRLQLLAGDCAWPLFAWWDERSARGGFVAGPAQTGWGETLWEFTERGGEQAATLWVGAPGVRERRYTHMTTQAESADRAPRRVAGARVAMEFQVEDFACADLAVLFARLHAWAEERSRETRAPVCVGQARAVGAVAEHFDRDLWLEQPEIYAVDLPGSRSPYQTGWCGGVIAQYAMLAAPGIDARMRERARRHLATVARDGMAPSGLFRGRWSPQVGWAADFWWEAEAAPWRASWTLTRRQADSLFFGVRAAQVRGEEPGAVWATALRGAATALTRAWEADGEWGFFLDDKTGRVAVGGSTGGALVPGALALAAAWAGGEARWLKAACAGAEALVNGDLARGVTTGGPGDALLAPDSESIAGLLESLVTLWEATGSRAWLGAAARAAAQLATWVMPYDYVFPEGSEFGRLGVRSAGTVFANAQNKHSAPGLCTHSGWALLRLFRATGEVSWLRLAARIARAIPQCASLPERPIHAQDGRVLPSGWINERVNTSDWDNNLGGVFHGPCWCETSLLLTAAELPGVYAQPDTGVAESFDVVQARWRDGALELHNPGSIAAQVRVALEPAARAGKTPLRTGWVADLPLVTVPAGGTVRWTEIRSGVVTA